ncbi:hypothetical protein PoB_000960900 [Plakobranchus ocellatus]|uniref:Uncharacterized protein n=1 Tax=Plakobranchus ocellatus TaxID=259542 RepID=A0AAV3YLT3_9GAST|nr:hypothetical protein PoB_000960900 [Plakobranchus ocellatus]
MALHSLCHKPLLGIIGSCKPTSVRIDRWRLRLMPYEFNLIYRPGKDQRTQQTTSPDTQQQNLQDTMMDKITSTMCSTPHFPTLFHSRKSGRGLNQSFCRIDKIGRSWLHKLEEQKCLSFILI